jgi:hypothetical protein
MLTVLEGLGNFIEHGVSFLFLPTDFQALSFTSPQALVPLDKAPSCLQHNFFLNYILYRQKTKCPHQGTDAGIFARKAGQNLAPELLTQA